MAQTDSFHLLQGHAWRSSVAVGLAGRIAGVPAIATLHRIYYPSVERRLDRHLQRLWRAVVVDSGAVRDLLVSEAGIDRDRIEVIPNFVADELFEDAREPDASSNRRLKILVAAHFKPVKGHRFALEAIAQLERSEPGGVELDLLGQGPPLDECKDRAATLGVDHLVHFHGRRSDLASWLHRADVVLLPRSGRDLA